MSLSCLLNFLFRQSNTQEYYLHQSTHSSTVHSLFGASETDNVLVVVELVLQNTKKVAKFPGNQQRLKYRI